MNNIKDLVSRLEAKQELDPELEEARLKSQKELVEINGREKFFDLRDKWSNWIIVWISAFIIFHIAITILVGCGALDFKDHQWLLPSIIIENFLQVIGMGYVIVNFLYPSK